jgi:hypothetical protein
MTLPGYLLGFVIASLLGVLFHLWRGGHIGRLLLFVVLSWAGFWAGHFIGNYLSFSLGKFGVLNISTAILGSLIFLIVGNWLSRFEK